MKNTRRILPYIFILASFTHTRVVAGEPIGYPELYAPESGVGPSGNLIIWLDNGSTLQALTHTYYFDFDEREFIPIPRILQQPEKALLGLSKDGRLFYFSELVYYRAGYRLYLIGAYNRETGKEYYINNTPLQYGSLIYPGEGRFAFASIYETRFDSPDKEARFMPSRSLIKIDINSGKIVLLKNSCDESYRLLDVANKARLLLVGVESEGARLGTEDICLYDYDGKLFKVLKHEFPLRIAFWSRPVIPDSAAFVIIGKPFLGYGCSNVSDGNVDDTEDVYIIHPGGIFENITRGEFNYLSYEISPDGRYVAIFHSEESETDNYEYGSFVTILDILSNKKVGRFPVAESWVVLYMDWVE